MAANDRRARRVREHAYFLWLNAGKPEGRDVEFWVQAEREVAAPTAVHSHIRRYFSLGFAFFLVLSIVLFALAAGAKGLLVAAVGFSVATASVFVAWLLGLLFGIPRSAVAASRRGSTDQHASNEISNASESSINTNLEQISDWLTKTIIGVGLTQLYYIPKYVWYVAGQLNQASLNGVDGGRLFILSIAGAAGAGGFWLGYVYVRTSITELLEEFRLRVLGMR